MLHGKSREAKHFERLNLVRDKRNEKIYETLRADLIMHYNSCGPLDAINASKRLINQSEQRILQIDQPKNSSKHLQRQVNCSQ
jgi:hypothetical protein